MKTIALAILLVLFLCLLGCGSPQSKLIEGTWSVSMTPTVGQSGPMAFNIMVLTNPDNSTYVANMFITTSNGCVDTSANKSVGYDATSKQVTLDFNSSSGGVFMGGSMIDSQTGTGNYSVNGSSQTCQGGGMFTMTRIPNPGPNRGGR